MSVTSIGLSGMQAAEARLLASASNLANLGSYGSLAGAGRSGGARGYTPVDTVQISAGEGAGVAITYQARQPATRPAAAPEFPLADRSGLVAAPNVDPVQEALDQISARQAFEANARVVRAAQTMQRSLFDVVA